MDEQAELSGDDGGSDDDECPEDNEYEVSEGFLLILSVSVWI